MADPTRDFYDALAGDYVGIFGDWRAAVHRQASALAPLIAGLAGPGTLDILDCTCGIGTQAIGLALHGHRVHGSDLSPEAVELARKNAASFNLQYPMSFSSADLLAGPPIDSPRFDVVLAADNSIAHFLTDEELNTALRNMLGALKPNGLLMLTVRDYDALRLEAPQSTPVRSSEQDGRRRINFQVWHWSPDRSRYDMEMFILNQDGEAWQTRCLKTTLRAITRTELEAALNRQPVHYLRWHHAAQTGFYQPIVTARKLS